jgi:hypothetical protein
VDGSPLSKRGAKDDKVSVACTVFTNGFRVAQKVDFYSEAHAFNDVIPIRRMDITFVTKQDLRYRLYLSHDIDMPWNFFDNYYYNYDLPGIGGINIVWPPPILVPKVCDPEDFFLGTSGGDFACIIPGSPPGQNGCTTITGPTSGDLVNLYSGATYQVEYVVDFAGAYALGGALAATGGAPLWGQVNFGYFNDHGTIYQSEEFEVSPDAAPGQGGLYGLLLSATPHSNHIHVGASLSARVRYVSGPDPRFENIECVDGDTGYGGLGDSNENQAGDGTSLVFVLTGAYVPGSTRVFVGGFFMRPGFEYTESDPEAGEITFTVAPTALTSVTVFYQAVGELI